MKDNIDTIAVEGIKVITNAGMLKTPSLVREGQKLCGERQYQDLVDILVTDVDISELLQGKQEAKEQRSLIMCKLSQPDHSFFLSRESSL
jgi:hypothetical protein